MSDWDWYERDLAAKLGALSDGDFVVTELPANAGEVGAEPPKKSWFRRAAPDPRPYVQFMRNEKELIGPLGVSSPDELTTQADH